jgi:hypothetical protein
MEQTWSGLTSRLSVLQCAGNALADPERGSEERFEAKFLPRVPMTVMRPSSDISLLDCTHGAEPSVWINSERLLMS